MERVGRSALGTRGDEVVGGWARLRAEAIVGVWLGIFGSPWFHARVEQEREASISSVREG